MPIMGCQKDGKPGFKYGDTGHCYTYEESGGKLAAYNKALKQAQAIKASQQGNAQ